MELISVRELFKNTAAYADKEITVGGWVTEQCGGIPPVGEVFRYKKLEIKVVKTTRQKVIKIRSLYDETLSEDEE